MEGTIRSFGAQLVAGAHATHTFDIPYRRIISCGMGGSSVAGEVLSTARTDVIVHWDYALPATARPTDLVVCTSWSGETTETISSYDAARELGAPTLIITTGGTLAARAQRDSSPCILLPTQSIRPRFAVGTMVGALFGALGLTGTLPALDASVLEATGKQAAGAIGSRIPIFYTAYAWRKIGGFFKTNVNETTKLPSWSGSFPSVAHNELMGWSRPEDHLFTPVLVQTTADDPRARRDMDALVALLARIGYTVPTIQVPGSGVLDRMLNGYVLALWVSYHMALARGLDPAEQQWIDEFKRLKNA